MRFAARNRHRKRAADANRARHPHAATVQFDQFLNEGQSNPRAFMCPGGRALDAMKALEYLLELVVGNSHNRVADLQFHGAVHRLQRYRHLALERELESIGKKIRYDFSPCRDRRRPAPRLVGSAWRTGRRHLSPSESTPIDVFARESVGSLRSRVCRAPRLIGVGAPLIVSTWGEVACTGARSWIRSRRTCAARPR